MWCTVGKWGLLTYPMLQLGQSTCLPLVQEQVQATPFHSGCELWAITHANPLCLFFWTKALLTRESVPWFWVSWRTCLVGCSLKMGPNRGFCQCSRDVRNWSTSDQWHLWCTLLGMITRRDGTGSQMHCCCGSCGVTGGPSNSWFVGTVKENRIWVHWGLVANCCSWTLVMGGLV